MLPNLSDYMKTFQNPHVFLADSDLVGCSCPKDPLGQPNVQSGGFALTFRLESPNKKWAVRCFHRDVADRAKRYTAISLKLKEPEIQQSGYFVDFDYQPKGVTVNGQQYPIVKMSWAQGTTLGAFLETNYRNPVLLQSLQKSLMGLYKFLSFHHIAHGDIQPGNLMVSNDGKMVQLIDYDGMFVPGMENLKAAETGVPNFQHPQRQGKNPWNDKLDRFPFIILDIALTVLQKNPSYWAKTNSSDEKVLFETTDYLAPYASPIFNQLKADPELSSKILILQQICCSDFGSIPSADNYLQFKPSVTPLHKVAAQPQTITISYKGNYPVLDAVDVRTIANNVGNVVEIVGKIVDLKGGLTQISGRYGRRPYMFVNFVRWKPRTDSFRLVFWSTVLNQFNNNRITSVSGSLKGQYVSVTGMIRRYSTQYGINYQIVPTSARQVLIIDKADADFRLGRTKKTLKQSFGGPAAATVASAAAGGSNANKLVSVLGGKARGQTSKGAMVPPRPNLRPTYPRKPVPQTVPSPPPAPRSNAGKLKNLQVGWNISGGTSKTSSAPPPRQSSTPTTTSYKPPVKSGSGCCLWLIGIIIVLVYLGKVC